MAGNRDVYLQAIRGASIAAVALIHCLPQEAWVIAVRPFLNFAVAAFIFLSGYLTPMGRTRPPLPFYKKRAGKIAPPYVLWSAFYLLARRVFAPLAVVCALLIGGGVGATVLPHRLFAAGVSHPAAVLDARPQSTANGAVRRDASGHLSPLCLGARLRLGAYPSVLRFVGRLLPDWDAVARRGASLAGTQGGDVRENGRNRLRFRRRAGTGGFSMAGSRQFRFGHYPDQGIEHAMRSGRLGGADDGRFGLSQATLHLQTACRPGRCLFWRVSLSYGAGDAVECSFAYQRYSSDACKVGVCPRLVCRCHSGVQESSAQARARGTGIRMRCEPGAVKLLVGQWANSSVVGKGALAQCV